MKKQNITILIAALLLASCSAEMSRGDYADAPPFYGVPQEMVVTVRQDSTGTVFFQKGHNARFLPFDEVEFTGECRAFGQMTVYAEEVPFYGHRCLVHWMENIAKGQLASGTPTGFGDGIDVILNTGITSVEDGYLTVHYYAWWGEPAGHHDILLAYRGDGQFDLLHNAHGDGHENYTEGLVYYDINALFPPTAEPIGVTLNWVTTSGQNASVNFEFVSRK